MLRRVRVEKYWNADLIDGVHDAYAAGWHAVAITGDGQTAVYTVIYEFEEETSNGSLPE